MTTLPDIDAKGMPEYLHASLHMEGWGSKGAKPRPFNYPLAVRQFHHWVYAAALLRANAAAGVPLRLYRRGTGGRKAAYDVRAVDRGTLKYLHGRRGDLKPSRSVMEKVAAFGGDVVEVVEPHPVLKVLSDANDDDNGYEISVEKYVELQLTGNHYWYVVDGKGPLRGTPAKTLWMPSEWTEIVPVKGGNGSRVAGYVYGKNTEVEARFEPDEVIHFRGVRSGNLFYGTGWVERAWQAVGLHNAKRTEDLAFKDNMSRPDWLLSIKSGANDKAIERLQSALEERFRGPEKSGKPMLATGEITATALQWEVKELGTPTRLIEEIAAVSGVPVAMLLSNDPNRAGSDNARLSFFRQTVRPDCLRDEQKLNQCWVPRFDGSEDYFLAYDHVSFEDEEQAAKRVVALVAGCILSPNEGRSELGYPDAEGADTLFPPAGNTGGSAGLLGNMSPDQNDERRDRKVLAKGMARMPKPSADADALAFKRAAFLGYQKDGTVGDMLANLTDLGELVEDVGLTRTADYEEPFVPIVSATGPVVNGETLTDAAGDIVGGGPGLPPVEVVQVNKDGEQAGNAPDLSQD